MNNFPHGDSMWQLKNKTIIHMKNILILLWMFAGTVAFAQQDLSVGIMERQTSQGLQPAFETEIPQASGNDAIKILESKLVNKGLFSLFSRNPKFVQEKDEWIMREVTVKQISSDPLTVYAQVTEFPEKIFVKLFFKEGEQFIGRDSLNVKTGDTRKFVREFAVEVYRDAVGNELKDEENKLRSLERDLKQMGRRLSSNERKVSNLRSDNQEMRSEIRTYEMRLQRKDTFSAEGEGAVIIMDQHAADTKKLNKDIRSNQRKINRNERQINKFERQGNRNLSDQSDLLNTMDRQKIVINEVKTKLQNIK
jgi:hypothetical protein